MQEDDAFDAELTSLGIEQAIEGRKKNEHLLQNIDLVVSSPLSRALKTADLTVCPEKGLPVNNSNNNGENSESVSKTHPPRLVIEELREINGWLLNAKRRTRTELQEKFHKSWDFNNISQQDETWTSTMETYSNCSERGYQSLLWLLRRKEEDKILVVSHGGILRFCMCDHPLVRLVDGRSDDDKRFSNCEMREYVISTLVSDDNDGDNDGGTVDRPVVILTETTHNLRN
jgi:broad specificity phosphatase PhoE